MVTSNSCSGTCLIFSSARQPKVSDELTAPARAGRSAEPIAASTFAVSAAALSGTARAVVVGTVLMRGPPGSSWARRRSWWWWPVGPGRGVRLVLGGRPVRARKTSSRLGWPSEYSLTTRAPLPHRCSAPATSSGRGHPELSEAGSESRSGTCSSDSASSRATSRALGRVGDADLHRARADRGLQLAAGALGDHAAVVDDGDPVRQLVGLLEVLGGQQDRGARAHEGPDDLHTWLRLRGSSPVVGSSRNISSGRTTIDPAMSMRRRMPPE